MKEAAQEEAAIMRCECAQASDPPTEQSRGATWTAGAPHDPFGYVDEREDIWSKEKTRKKEVNK